MSLPYRIVPAAAPLRRPVMGASPFGGAFASAQTRQWASNRTKGDIYKRVIRDTMKTNARETKEAVLSEGQREATTTQIREGSMPMFPTTFVSAPISKYPTKPSDFLSYQWQRIKAWGTGWLAILGTKVDSMGNKWTTRPRFKARRRKIAPTAKILHRELLEAFAAGDKATIKRVCMPAYADQFIRAIERRKKDERVLFELVKYNKPLFYPGLRSHLIGNSNMYDSSTLTEQAVVAIASTQKISKQMVSTGQLIPGSVKIKDQVEYVVLWREVKAKTFETGQWRIWGTTNPTTLETVRERNEFWNKEQAKMAGWKTD